MDETNETLNNFPFQIYKLFSKPTAKILCDDQSNKCK